MAVPKRKVSKSRRDKRRSSVWKLKMPAIIRCENCKSFKMLHKVCKDCGYYRGKQVVVVEGKKA